MKDRKVHFLTTTLLLLVVLASTSCTLQVINLEATRTASAMQTTSVTSTVTPFPPVEVAIKSSHKRWVTAMEGDSGLLRQKTELSDCAWFTEHHLANGKIALVTCNDRYVTAPESGTERQDWMLGQESKLGKCGQFDLYELGNDRVAFKTCAGKFFTAGDGNWPAPLQWAVVAETDILQDWEIFTVLQP